MMLRTWVVVSWPSRYEGSRGWWWLTYDGEDDYVVVDGELAGRDEAAVESRNDKEEGESSQGRRDDDDERALVLVGEARVGLNEGAGGW